MVTGKKNNQNLSHCMWYKISCWKPENNSQLLFSALHRQSSSALGSWWILAFGQKAPRPYPGAGEAGAGASMKVNITTGSFHVVCNRSCCQAKPFDVFPDKDPQNQWQTVSVAWSGHWDQSWGTMGDTGLSLQPAHGSTADQASSEPGSAPWWLIPLGWHPKCLKPWYHVVAWLHHP